MPQALKIQRLMAPMGDGEAGLSDAAIDMPEQLEDLASELRKIFRFDNMGAAEFEWDAVPEALHHFLRLAQAQKIVQIEYDPDVPGAKTIYALTAADEESILSTIYFIDDQLSQKPGIKCLKPTGIKKTVFAEVGPDDDYDDGLDPEIVSALETFNRQVGWFDLDNKRFLFVDPVTLGRFRGFFGLHHNNMPTISKGFDYESQPGETEASARRKAQIVANVLKTAIRVHHNPGYNIIVHPEPVPAVL